MAPRDYPGVASLGCRAAEEEHRLQCHTGWGSSGNSATLASSALPVHPTLQSTGDTEALASCCVQSTTRRERARLMEAGKDTKRGLGLPRPPWLRRPALRGATESEGMQKSGRG